MINPTTFTSNGFMTNSIMPISNKTVMVDGEVYKVIKVPNNNILARTFAPTYKEVVIINGKQYEVYQTPAIVGCDRTRDIIVIDGKVYTITDGSGLHLENLLNNLNVRV